MCGDINDEIFMGERDMRSSVVVACRNDAARVAGVMDVGDGRPYVQYAAT